MSRVSEIQKQFERNANATKNCIGSDGGPFNIALPEADLEYLFSELSSRTTNISALQKKLSACKNIHTQQNAMIERRDRSIKKAHDYIETLKAKLRERSTIGQAADEA